MEQELTLLKEEVENLKRILSNSDLLSYEIAGAFDRRKPIFLFGSATLDFGNISAGSNESKSITVVGAQPGDAVFLGIPGPVINGSRVFVSCVSSTDTVTVFFNNVHPTASIDPVSGVYTAVVMKKP